MPSIDAALAVSLIKYWFKPTDDILLEPMRIEPASNGHKPRAVPIYKLRRYLRCATPEFTCGRLTGWVPWTPRMIEGQVGRWLEQVHAVQAHAFFGVAPRELDDRRADKAHQIRRLPGLWADFDGVTRDQVRERIEAAGVPLPSRMHWSGGGVHCFWKFAEEFVIDDAGPVEPIYYRWIDGERKPRPYLRGPDESWVPYLRNPPLSPKAQQFTDMLAGLYAKLTDHNVAADHVQNLNRLLRMPGSINHKYDPPQLVEQLHVD